MLRQVRGVPPPDKDRPMNFVAIKMLTGDRAKYLGLIFAIAFASFLLENQSSIFVGGRIRANIRLQEARQEVALARYEQTVLGALEDTENALVAYGEEHTRLQRLVEAVDASQVALTLSRELYVRGLVDFLTVLDNQRSLYATQDQRVQSERTLVVSLIALYKALGGGWETTETQT